MQVTVYQEICPETEKGAVRQAAERRRQTATEAGENADDPETET